MRRIGIMSECSRASKIVQIRSERFSRDDGDVNCLSQMHPACCLSQTSLCNKSGDRAMVQEVTCAAQMMIMGVGFVIIFFIKPSDNDSGEKSRVPHLRWSRKCLDEFLDAQIVIVCAFNIGTGVCAKPIIAARQREDTIHEHRFLQSQLWHHQCEMLKLITSIRLTR